MNSTIEFIQNNISAFDLIATLIIIYSMAQCASKGFTASLLSFSKWLIALVVTIVLVPKFNPWVQDYIESKFITDIGLGIFIFIISLFILKKIRKFLSSDLDKQIFGIIIDKVFGVLYGLIFTYFIYSTILFTFINLILKI